MRARLLNAWSYCNYFPGVLERASVSSIVYEAIRTISSLLIFFLRKNFKPRKRIQTIFTLLEVFVREKNCCLCCLVFACFCFVSWFLLVMCFCAFKIFKKKNRLEIVLITSYTILLMCTPIEHPIENYFSTN